MTAPDTDLYRVADLELFPAGDGLVLAHSHDRGATRLLRAGIADLLIQCRDFRTLDEHIRRYLRGRQASRATLSSMRAELQKLDREGYLISQKRVLGGLREPPGRTSPAGITSVGFLTNDRAAALQRAVASYVENGRRFGRDRNVVVMDDSADPESRSANRRVLAGLKDRLGARIAYAGREEKTAFVEKLIEAGNLPAEVVRFACLGDEGYGATTVGANRNALLLHTVGELLFSADDDTVCNIAAAPDRGSGLALTSADDPTELYPFPDRETALRSLPFVQEDLVALHERYLGRDVRSCVEAQDEGVEISLDGAEPGFVRQLASSSPGRIGLTSNGAFGDCAWDYPHYHVVQQGRTFERMTRSEQAYRVAATSRELMQVVPRLTVTERADPPLGASMGLDNRELLPPFTPVGRAEEAAFGAALSRCFEGVRAAHLPYALLHDPVGPRSFSSRPMFSVGPNDWIPSCINTFDAGLATAPEERLINLGRYVEEIGRLPGGRFEEFVRSHVWRSMSTLIGSLEEQSRGLGEAGPSYWVQDVGTLVAALRRSALEPPERLYALDGGREPTQRLMVRFGRVLSLWPTVVETARELRAQGHRLAQPI